MLLVLAKEMCPVIKYKWTEPFLSWELSTLLNFKTVCVSFELLSEEITAVSSFYISGHIPFLTGQLRWEVAA